MILSPRDIRHLRGNCGRELALCSLRSKVTESIWNRTELRVTIRQIGVLKVFQPSYFTFVAMRCLCSKYSIPVVRLMNTDDVLQLRLPNLS